MQPRVVELPKDVFIQLLEGDGLDADEELVFGALIRWGERNKDPSGTVGDALQDLMPLLRVEAMEVEFLRETVRPSGLVSEKRLNDALFNLFDSEKKGKRRGQRTFRRGSGWRDQ